MREELTWVLQTENRSRQDLRETERGVERVDKRTNELNRTWSRFQSMVGGIAVGAGLARFGQHVNKVTNTIRDQRRETQHLLDLSQESLDAVQSKTRAIAQVYDTEYGDVLRTSNALAKRFEKTQLEALQKIEEGYAKGGSQADDYLKQLREFNAELKAGGQNLDEFVGTVTVGTKEGIFDDKLPDALREFTKEIQEQRKPVQEALENAFGAEFSDRIKREVEEGSLGAMEALDLISEKLNEVEPNIQQKRELLETLFKGPGEAIGTGLMDNLGEITASLKEQDGAFSGLQDHQQEMVANYEELSRKQQEFEQDTMRFGNRFEDMWVGIRTVAWEALGNINEALTRVIGSAEQLGELEVNEELEEHSKEKKEAEKQAKQVLSRDAPVRQRLNLLGISPGEDDPQKAIKEHIKGLQKRRKAAIEEMGSIAEKPTAQDPSGIGTVGLSIDTWMGTTKSEMQKMLPWTSERKGDQTDRKGEMARRAQRMKGEIEALRKFQETLQKGGGGDTGGGDGGDGSGAGEPGDDTPDKTPATSVKARAPQNFNIEIQEMGNNLKVMPQTLEEGGEEVQDLLLNAMLSAVNSLQTAQENSS